MKGEVVGAEKKVGAHAAPAHTPMDLWAFPGPEKEEADAAAHVVAETDHALDHTRLPPMESSKPVVPMELRSFLSPKEGATSVQMWNAGGGRLAITPAERGKLRPVAAVTEFACCRDAKHCPV